MLTNSWGESCPPAAPAGGEVGGTLHPNPSAYSAGVGRDLLAAAGHAPRQAISPARLRSTTCMEAPDTALATRLIEGGELTPAQLDAALEVCKALMALGEPRRFPA